MFTAFLARREQFHQVRLAASLSAEPYLPSNTLAALQAYLGRQGQNSVTAGQAALALIYHDLLQRASALSYLDGFRVMALLLVVAIPFVWIMKKPHFKSHPAQEA